MAWPKVPSMNRPSLGPRTKDQPYQVQRSPFARCHSMWRAYPASKAAACPGFGAIVTIRAYGPGSGDRSWALSRPVASGAASSRRKPARATATAAIILSGIITSHFPVGRFGSGIAFSDRWPSSALAPQHLTEHDGGFPEPLLGKAPEPEQQTALPVPRGVAARERGRRKAAPLQLPHHLDVVPRVGQHRGHMQ